jgi:ABC-type polysaccharide/polyol phosphate export permease
MVFSVLLCVLYVAGFKISFAYVYLLPVIVLQLVLIYGVSLLVACAIPLIPDLQFVVSNLIRAMMFLSAIFYPITAIPEAYQHWFLANPMVPLIEAYRQILLHGQPPDLSLLLNTALFSAIFAALGTIAITRLDPYIARILSQR